MELKDDQFLREKVEKIASGWVNGALSNDVQTNFAANNGGGGGGSSGTAAPTIASTVDFSASKQLVSADNNSCLSITSSSTTQNTAWYVAGTFVLSNSCTSAQPISEANITKINTFLGT